MFIAHRGEAHRPVRIRGAAVALHLDSDHLARLRQRLHPSLHLADCRQPAMDQNQRFALAVDLVIEIDAVHVSVAAARWFHLRFHAQAGNQNGSSP
jgi:hypothetical protein